MSDQIPSAEAGSGAETPWYGNELPEDLSNWQTLQEAKDLPTFVEGYKNLASKFGNDTERAKTTISMAEDKTPFLDALGIKDEGPVQADSYTWKPAEDQQWDEGADKIFREAAAEAGLPPAAFDKFMAEGYSKVQDAVLESAKQQFEAQMAEREQALGEMASAEWGDKSEAGLQIAFRGLAEAGLSQEVTDQLKQGMVLGGVPAEAQFALIKLGHAFAQSKGEASFGDAGGSTPKSMTPDQARARLAEMTADKEAVNAFMNPADPRHQSVKEERARLSIIAKG